MISVFLGNVGSGKTVCAVKYIIEELKRIETYTNISFKNTKGVHLLKPDMIIKKEFVRDIKRQNGKVDKLYKEELNLDFWKNQKKNYSVCIDEFHNIAGARDSQTNKNKIFNRWLTMLRRVLESKSGDDGELIIITQVSNQIDIIARMLCHQVRYHICHYRKRCKKCGRRYREHSEHPEPRKMCRCGSYDLKKENFRIEVWKFSNMTTFLKWYEGGMLSFYRHYYINDIEKYFKYYNTFQWDNLFEDY